MYYQFYSSPVSWSDSFQSKSLQNVLSSINISLSVIVKCKQILYIYVRMSIQLSNQMYNFYYATEVDPDKDGTTKGGYLEGVIQMPSNWRTRIDAIG